MMKKETKINNHTKRRAALATVLLIAMLSFLMSPYCASAVSDEKSSADQKTTAAGETQNLLKETGEAVKCKGGTLIAPVGDPEAEAPKLKAKAAALYSFDLGKIVYAKNEDKRLDPYSMTKILTCWLAMENLDMDEVVTVSEDATQEYVAGTTIWLKPGEKITVKDLLYGAMLESGNDAAYALGEAVSGSEAAFADLMNKTVEEWGCKDTHFVNANGWKNEKHYTTAHDMAIIAARCFENKELMELSVTPKYTSSPTNMTEARSMKNYFLGAAGKAEGLTGGKSGTWSDDDCAITAAFSDNGLSEIIVLIGDTDKGRPKDLRTLMEFSHEVTPGFAVPAAGSAVETVRVRHGEKTRLDLTADETTYVYPASSKARDIRTEITTEKLEAPVKKGDVVGDLLIYCDDQLAAERKLIATEDIETGWLPSYIYISNAATLNILKAAGCIAVLILILTYVRRKNGSKEKREARRRLREKYRGKH